MDKEVSPKGNRRDTTLISAGVLLAGALVAGVFVGCQKQGETKSQTQATAPTDSLDPKDAMQAFADCMRDNGIANYPDPTDDGINLRGTGIDRNTPEFKAAQTVCIALLPRPPDDAEGGPRREERGRGERREGSGGNSAAWQKVVPGGDCECADGSRFAFWDRKADPTKVVLYLDGGGVCFDAASCAMQNTPGSGEREGPDYDPNIDGEYPDGGGMFDFDHADNPFRGYSFIYVPLCTADAHLGNITRKYSPELTVEHKGFVNGTAALSFLAEHYPDAAQVVVVGKSAGSTAAPIYGGLVADFLPDARITVFGAQSGAFPDDPNLNARIGELWGAFGTMPNWEVNKGLTARDWGNRRFWIQAGLHHPDIVMAHFDYAFDPHAVQTLEYLAVPGVDPSNTLALIDANEAAIEAAGVVLHSYTAPGEGHGILEFEMFYDMEVNGVRLVDWIKSLIDGKPLEDVHCDKCKE